MKKSSLQINFIKNQKKIIITVFILFSLLVQSYNVNAELLKASCWASPPQHPGYADPRYIWTPDRDGLTECVYDFGLTPVSDTRPETVTFNCPDSVICCSTRINSDITVTTKVFPWYIWSPIVVQSQTLSRFSNCGGGSCGYLNSCTNQCILKPGNSCFDGQESCSGNSYLLCSSCGWQNRGVTPGKCGIASNYGQNCNLNACGQPGGTIQANGQCSGAVPAVPAEVCDGRDNNCNGAVDEGFSTGTCTLGVGECARTGSFVCQSGNSICTAIAGSPTAEICDNKDNNCNGQTDEGCDDDNDNYCDVNIQIVGTPSTCTSGGNDRNDNDAMINPGIQERCDDKDNDQDNLLDEGCDDDNDNYCDSNIQKIGTPSTCTSVGNDCKDDNSRINPGASECCDLLNQYDENCNGQINEICDKDRDGIIDSTAPLCDSSQQTIAKQEITQTLAMEIINRIRLSLGIK